MPRFFGLSEDEAQSLALATSLTISIQRDQDANTAVGCGIVSGQSPGVGANVEPRATIYIFLADHAVCRGEEPVPETVSVPFVLSTDVSSAQNTLTSLGLTAVVTRRDDAPEQAVCGTVVTQSPPSGTLVALGTDVILGIPNRRDCP